MPISRCAWLVVFGLWMSVICNGDGGKTSTSIGAHGGLASIRTDSGFHPDSTSTPAAFGVNFETHLYNILYLRVEGNYIDKSYGSQSVTVGTQTYTVSPILKYLEFPVMLAAKFGVPSMHLSLFAGPSLAFAVSKSLTTSVSDTSGGSSSTSIALPVSSTDFGFHVGYGIDVDAGENLNFLFNIRYIMGLTNINASGAGNDVKNQALLFLAGVSYTL